MTAANLILFGLGYTGTAIAACAAASGWEVTATSRNPSKRLAPPGVNLTDFDCAAASLGEATHILQTAAPDERGDPALARHGDAIRANPRLRWAGYLSTTGVYGDRDGDWVDEDTPVAPTVARAQRRVEAELAWVAALPGRPVDLFRLAGIYGPGRSAFDDLRSGQARRVLKTGHLFGRIHRDDVAAAVVAAMQQARGPGPRVLNLADDEPAASADVTAEAARLLGVPVPPLLPFAEAVEGMSAMGRSFWNENRRVRSGKTQAQLGLRWQYPTYREGLRAILQQEVAERPLQ